VYYNVIIMMIIIIIIILIVITVALSIRKLVVHHTFGTELATLISSLMLKLSVIMTCNKIILCTSVSYAEPFFFFFFL
jgi:hypothetical protein